MIVLTPKQYDAIVTIDKRTFRIETAHNIEDCTQECKRCSLMCLKVRRMTNGSIGITSINWADILKKHEVG